MENEKGILEENIENVHNTEKEEIIDLDKEFISEDELFNFIGGKNLDYYAKIYRKHKESNNFASWNFASFLFTPLWLLYRKLYGWFAIYAVAGIVIEGLGVFSIGLDIILKIVLIVIAGIFGNCIYINHCKKKINKINNELSGYKGREEVLKANGGTSTKSIIIFLLLVLVFIGTIILFVSVLNSAMSIGLYSFL